MRPFHFVLFAALAAAVGACKATTPARPASAPVAVAHVDPPPPASDLVSLEISPAHRFLRADQPAELLARVRLDARSLRRTRRPPINLALVVDTSGSMEGKAIDDARAASLLLLDALAEGDRLAVVSFDTETQVLVPSTMLDKKTIAEARPRIGAMKARGTTDLAGGLAAGLAQVAQGFQSDGVNRVVLVGDGVPNDEAAVLPIAQQAAQQAVPITVLGLGVDHDESLMASIAQQSGGKYHFVRESSAVARVFEEELLRLKQAIARNAVLRLVPGPGVKIEEVVGLPASPAGAETRVSLGDLSEGETRDVIVRLSVAPRHAGSAVEIMDTELSFDAVPAASQRVAERSFLGVHASDDTKEIASGEEVDVERTAARVEVAAKIVRAVALARSGDQKQAMQTLDDAEKEALLAARALGDGELAEKAKTFPQLRKDLAAMQPPPPAIAKPDAPPTPPRPVAAPSPNVYETQAAAMGTIQGS